LPAPEELRKQESLPSLDGAWQNISRMVSIWQRWPRSRKMNWLAQPLREHHRSPPPDIEHADRIDPVLSGRQLLLVVDNCEHRDGASETDDGVRTPATSDRLSARTGRRLRRKGRRFARSNDNLHRVATREWSKARWMSRRDNLGSVQHAAEPARSATKSPENFGVTVSAIGAATLQCRSRQDAQHAMKTIV